MTSQKWMQCVCVWWFPKNFDVFIKQTERAISHSYVFTKRQHGTRFKRTKTVSLFEKICNLSAGLWKELLTKTEFGLFSQFFLETALLRWNICENSFKFVRSISRNRPFLHTVFPFTFLDRHLNQAMVYYDKLWWRE